jgi:selenocysteine-specific elongation factor
VVRSYSPVKTIGGGAILNPVARKYRHMDAAVIQGLTGLAADDPEQTILFFLSLNGFKGLSFNDLRVMTNQTDKEKQTFVSGAIFDEFKHKVVEKIRQYHNANPLKEGMPTQEMKSKFRYIKDPKFFHILFTRLEKENIVTQDKNLVKLADFEVALQVDQHQIRENILGIYRSAGLTPPFFRTVCEDLDLDKKTAKDVLQMLIDEKQIIKTKDDLFFDARAMARLEEELVAFLKQNESITTPEFKDMTGISRKYVIPLIEYFDSIHLTIRVGDTRQLRRKS